MTTTQATDFDIARLRARRTNKWHKFAPDVLPAWVADMDFGVAPSITAALARLTRDQEYGYAARDGVLAAAFVRRMERRFGWRTDPADAIAIGDLVQASFSSVMAFSEPGDAILLQLPSYPPFMRAIEDTGRRLIANPMRDDGTRWVPDLGAYEAAPDPRLRMLIFCHPQNPTGRAFTGAELEEVADFAIRHDLVVVSDEIHADIVYSGNTHIPLASLQDAGRVYQGGDLDNRLKTLFDALAVPPLDQVVNDASISDPVYCLLEDDALIMGIDVQTHRLLARPNLDRSNVVLIIDVDVRVVRPRGYNLTFIGD